MIKVKKSFVNNFFDNETENSNLMYQGIFQLIVTANEIVRCKEENINN